MRSRAQPWRTVGPVHLKIGDYYDTTTGTLWKDGTYYARGTRVMVVGMHLEQGYCVRFPDRGAEGPLEVWESWEEPGFLAAEGTVDPGPELSAEMLTEARTLLADAEDGCHLHLQDEE